MSAFAAAINVAFADPNISVGATYRAGGVGGVPVRVIRSLPEGLSEFNGGRFISAGVLIDVRISECPQLQTGDRFVIGGEELEVIGDPARDADRLIWKAQARAV